MKQGLLKKNSRVSLLPRAAAAAVVRGEEQRQALERERELSGFEGQQAGVPGMGPAPEVIHQPGGNLISQLQHPSFTTLERLWRKLPEEGWFDPDLGPSAPVQFSIGSYTVPRGTSLWLFDYEFSVYRQSGVDPGDFVKAESGRFTNQLCFDVNIGGRREGDLSYQLDPDAVSVGRTGFETPTGSSRTSTTTSFDSSAANSFAAASNAGTSLLPARSNVQGARGMPFTMVVDEGAIVSLNCVIFNTLLAPLSSVEGRMAGYLIQTQVSRALINRVRPR